MPTKPANYLIWSNEHQAWWLPLRQGYTDRAYIAGRYTFHDAMEIVSTAMIGSDKLGGKAPEVAVPDFTQQTR